MWSTAAVTWPQSTADPGKLPAEPSVSERVTRGNWGAGTMWQPRAPGPMIILTRCSDVSVCHTLPFSAERGGGQTNLPDLQRFVVCWTWPPGPWLYWFFFPRIFIHIDFVQREGEPAHATRPVGGTCTWAGSPLSQILKLIKIYLHFLFRISNFLTL